MSEAAAPTALARAGASDAHVWRLGAPLAAIVALAALLNAHFGTATDVSWLITLAERVLDGQTPYVDFIEANPPASILLYLAPVAAARLFHFAPELTVALFGFAAAGASLALCAHILGGARLAERVGSSSLLVAAAVLLLLPGRTFNQRDAIAVMAMLPFLCVLAARAARAPISQVAAILAGVAVGVMAAIKPHYLLSAAAPALFVAWRIGPRALLVGVELYAAAAVAALYALGVAVFFPAFLASTLPMVAAVYVPVRNSAPFMLLHPCTIAWYLLTLCLICVEQRRWREPLVALPALASLGALATYFIQGKAWTYHAFPALALMILALGLAVGPRLRQPASAAVLLAPCVATACAGLSDAPSLIVAALAAVALALVALAASSWLGRTRPSWRERHFHLVGAAAGAASGLAFALLAFGHEQPALAKALAALAPHPTVLAISGDLGVGHPLVRNAGGVWVQSVSSLWITEGARKLMRERPHDEALNVRLAPYLRLDRDMLFADIARAHPDAILITEGGAGFVDLARSDPAVGAALQAYREIASDHDPVSETKLFARRDLIVASTPIDASESR